MVTKVPFLAHYRLMSFGREHVAERTRAPSFSTTSGKKHSEGNRPRYQGISPSSTASSKEHSEDNRPRYQGVSLSSTASCKERARGTKPMRTPIPYHSKASGKGAACRSHISTCTVTPRVQCCGTTVPAHRNSSFDRLTQNSVLAKREADVPRAPLARVLPGARHICLTSVSAR